MYLQKPVPDGLPASVRPTMAHWKVMLLKVPFSSALMAMPLPSSAHATIPSASCSRVTAAVEQ